MRRRTRWQKDADYQIGYYGHHCSVHSFLFTNIAHADSWTPFILIYIRQVSLVCVLQFCLG
jgi:hypothetical protein